MLRHHEQIVIRIEATVTKCFYLFIRAGKKKEQLPARQHVRPTFALHGKLTKVGPDVVAL
jgi:hypothetical protein